MATDDDFGDYGYEDVSTYSHSDQQEYLYDLIGFRQDDVPGDSYVRDTFWEIMYDDNLSAQERLDRYEELSDYLYEEYGLEFYDVWDWDDFRSWYDAA